MATKKWPDPIHAKFLELKRSKQAKELHLSNRELRKIARQRVRGGT